ncbi:MAG: right-handed parallel beta-helix repeat-containing protein [Actinobacteria bacterium]|nr:right-handed parallel beta-helix repeat-containing protein [Actinomycetota bacterium]
MIGLVVAVIAVATLVLQDRDDATSGSKAASEPSGDLAPLQDLIDARCRDGGVVELSGRYVIDDTVVIQGCRNLTIQGNGALLETDQLGPFTNGEQAGGDEQANEGEGEEEEEANDEQEGEQGGDRGNDQSGDQGKRQESKRVHVLIADSSDIVVRNLTVRGPNRTDDAKIGRPGVAVYDARYAKEHGFSIQGSSRVRLEDNRVEMVFGDGVNMGREPSTDVTISGLTVERNGRQGVHVARVSNALIERVEVVNGRRGGVDFEPAGSSWVVEDVEVRDSTFRTELLAFPAVGGKGQVRNVKIHDNVVLSARSFLALNGGHSGFQVYDNIGSDIGTYEGAMVTIGPNINDLDFRDNRLEPRAPDRPAFKLDSVTGVRITGNDVRPVGTLLEGDASSSLVCGNTTATGDEQPIPCPS